MGDCRGLRVLLGSLTLLSVSRLNNGHVRFVCPRPQSPRSDIYYQLPMNHLNSACGLGTNSNIDDGSNIMEVTPGPFTVRFEETVIHKDSSFQISLHGDNGTSCSLLNHIPHNNQARVVSPHCKENDYPIGHCLQSTYYVTVNIPDIPCRRCYLKLTFITVDSTKNLPCLQPNGTCKTYISCANINIKSTSPDKTEGLDSCSVYSKNLLGRWPYTRKENFQADLTSQHGQAVADFSFDYYDRSLMFSISTNYIGKITSVGVYQRGGDPDHESSEPVLRKSISVEDNPADEGLVTGVWQDINKDYLTHFTMSLFYVRVVTTEKTYKGLIKFVHEEYVSGVYYPHSASYSVQGWLNDPQFVGPLASYSAGVQPAGLCAPEPRYYMAALEPQLENSTSKTSHYPHGVLTMAFLDNRVHITGLFHGLTDQRQQTVYITGPILAGAKSFFVPLKSMSGGKFIDTTLDASSQMTYIDSTKFLKSVVVRSSQDQPDVMCGPLEQAILAVITGPDGFYGNAVFQFRKDTSLSFSIIVNGKGKRIMGVTLNGPARVGEVGQLMFDLTPYFSEKLQDNTWFANDTLQDLTSEMLLHLWQGHLYISVKLENSSMESRVVSGQISKPGAWYCNHQLPAFCPHFNLYLNGRIPDYGSQIVPTTAEAVFIVDRGKALQYSIQVQVSSPQELVLSAAVTEGGDKHLTIGQFKTAELDAGLHNIHVFEVHGKLPQISPVFEYLLRKGMLNLAVSTTQYPTGSIVGEIPKVQRPPCINKKKRFHVDWNLSDYQYINLNTVVDDIVMFTYSGNDTIYRLLNRMMYRSCDFTNATLIGQLLPSGHGTIQHMMKNPGEFYFASMINCNNSLKIAITVAGNEEISPGDCMESVYQRWVTSRLAGRGGTGVIGAIIGASLLAVVTMIIIVLLDRRRKSRAECTSGFQRF